MKQTIQERFWTKVHKTDKCWIWTAFKNKGGYGCLHVKKGGSIILAHRLSWEMHNGRKTPKDLFVCHHCDNPSCVNPEHLFIGNCADNNRDKVLKFRANAILTKEQVMWIRQYFKNSNYTQSEVGKLMGVGQDAISRVLNNESWQYTCQVN